MTPLLLAVSQNHYDIYMYLAFDLKCNMDALDAKRNNALHLALQTENIDFIKKLVHLDSDYGHMRAHKNS
jgi:ankyrin repeat protein